MSNEAHIFQLRLTSAVGGAAIFGLVSASLLPAPYFVAALLLALCFGFTFVGGTGYRILFAVASLDKSKQADASWSGATAVSAWAALIAFAALEASGRDGILVLAAYGAAINAAYAPVKSACVLAGCCVAARQFPSPFARSRIVDLRIVEICAALALFAASIAFTLSGWTAAGATAGVAGHFLLRLYSRWARKRLPVRFPPLTGPGFELVPLAVAAAVSAAALIV